MPRVSAEHKGAFEGTSLSVHDPSNRYKPVHVPLDVDFCPCLLDLYYMVRPCSLSFQTCRSDMTMHQPSGQPRRTYLIELTTI